MHRRLLPFSHHTHYIHPHQGKVTKPALVVVPSAADRFASYDVDVAGTQALEVREGVSLGGGFVFEGCGAWMCSCVCMSVEAGKCLKQHVFLAAHAPTTLRIPTTTNVLPFLPSSCADKATSRLMTTCNHVYHVLPSFTHTD